MRMFHVVSSTSRASDVAAEAEKPSPVTNGLWAVQSLWPSADRGQTVQLELVYQASVVGRQQSCTWKTFHEECQSCM